MKKRIYIIIILLAARAFAQQNITTEALKDSAAYKSGAIQELQYITIMPAVPKLNEISTGIITKQQIFEKINAVDIPTLLNSNVGVISNSNAGNGVGYSDIRIRNIDGSRINISINGVPFNDAESSQAYWVNIPALANSAKSIYIQRGLSNSTLSNYSLGAGIDILTNKIQEKPSAELNISLGSFHTFSKSISANTGLLNNHFYAEMRLSQINSDGYIDRASSDLNSYFLGLNYIYKNHAIWFNHFAGKEKTYQAWNGVPYDSLKTNRTYNVFDYENQTDNYRQSHYQLHYSYKKNTKLAFNSSLYFTNGKGYYEEFKKAQSFTDYGLQASVIGNDTFTNTDLIRRKWLENNLLGINARLKYALNTQIIFHFGMNYNSYFGKHFDEIIWMQYAGNYPQKIKYENDVANKNDWNSYFRVSYLFKNSWIDHVFIENNFRKIFYNFNGKDVQGDLIQQNYSPIFYNPKIGAELGKTSRTKFYLFAGINQKEPNRDDFINSTFSSRPKHEKLYNLELGARRKQNEHLIVNSNLYYMYFINQLTLNGKINDVGEYTRVNIPRSYRAGWETDVQYERKKLQIFSNLTLSINKSIEYTEFIDDFDSGEQIVKTVKNADLAYSPNVIFNNEIKYQLLNEKSNHQLYFGLISKYVSRQNIDNYSKEKYIIDAYFTNDFYISYKLNWNKKRTIFLKLSVNNIFNEEYETFAWMYKYKWNNEIQNDVNGFFPQAKRNVMFSANVLLNN